MLYGGPFNKSLVSDEFNQMCVDCSVEATIQALPNPGNLTKAMRVITFRNFKDTDVKIIRIGKIDFIPAKGTAQIMLGPDEPLPTLERTQ